MKKCGTCKREIPASKIRMHEIGCARSNYLCKVCGEVVAKDEKEEHEETAHVMVKCKHNCGFEANKAQFANHEETCTF
jgi:hypothetical protein